MKTIAIRDKCDGMELVDNEDKEVEGDSKCKFLKTACNPLTLHFCTESWMEQVGESKQGYTAISR